MPRCNSQSHAAAGRTASGVSAFGFHVNAFGFHLHAFAFHLHAFSFHLNAFYSDVAARFTSSDFHKLWLRSCHLLTMRSGWTSGVGTGTFPCPANVITLSCKNRLTCLPRKVARRLPRLTTEWQERDAAGVTRACSSSRRGGSPPASGPAGFVSLWGQLAGAAQLRQDELVTAKAVPTCEQDEHLEIEGKVLALGWNYTGLSRSVFNVPFRTDARAIRLVFNDEYSDTTREVVWRWIDVVVSLGAICE